MSRRTKILAAAAVLAVVALVVSRGIGQALFEAGPIARELRSERRADGSERKDDVPVRVRLHTARAGHA